MNDSPKYKRILIKLSGEAFQGDQDYGLDVKAIKKIAEDLARVRELGTDVVVVNGAGNLFRGRMGVEVGMDQAAADYIGMVATIMNSLALQEALEKIGQPTRVMSALELNKVAEPYIRRRAIRHLEKGRIVICAGGIGSPFFTTDTAGVLRAIELNCECMLKASNVDGVFESDPKQNPDAQKYSELSYDDVLSKKLKVLDATAVSLARDKNLPIIIFDFEEEESLKRLIQGEKIGSTIA